MKNKKQNYRIIEKQIYRDKWYFIQKKKGFFWFFLKYRDGQERYFSSIQAAKEEIENDALGIHQKVVKEIEI